MMELVLETMTLRALIINSVLLYKANEWGSIASPGVVSLRL